MEPAPTGERVLKLVSNYLTSFRDKLNAMATCRRVMDHITSNTEVLTSSKTIVIPLSTVKSFSGLRVIGSTVWIRIFEEEDIEHLVRYTSSDLLGATLTLMCSRELAPRIITRMSMSGRRKWIHSEESAVSPYSKLDTHISHDVNVLFPNGSGIGYGMVRMTKCSLVVTDMSVTEDFSLATLIKTANNYKKGITLKVCPGAISLPETRPLVTWNKEGDAGVSALFMSTPHRIKEAYMMILDSDNAIGDSMHAFHIGITCPFVVKYILLMSSRKSQHYSSIGKTLSMALEHSGIDPDVLLLSGGAIKVLCCELMEGQQPRDQLKLITAGYIDVLALDIGDILSSPILKDVEFGHPIHYPIIHQDLKMYSDMERPFNRQTLRNTMKRMVVSPTTEAADLMEYAEEMSQLYRGMSYAAKALTGMEGDLCSNISEFYCWDSMMNNLASVREYSITVGNYMELFGW